MKWQLFGIPLITSNIPVCHEVFDDFQNVKFIKNSGIQDLSIKLEEMQKKLPYHKNEKYFSKNTATEEVKIFTKLTKEKFDD